METLALQLLTIPALTTLFWFIANVYLKFPLNQISLIVSFILSVVVARLYFGKPKFEKEKTKPTKIFIFFLLILIGVIFLNLVLNLYWPIPAEYDAVANFDYKGQVFFLEQNIQGIKHVFHASYPFFTSLGNSAMYFLGFRIPKIYYSYLLISFTLLFYSLLKEKTNRLLALIGSLLLITTPMIFFQARIAYSNLSYMIYLGLALIYLVKFLQSSSHKDLKALSFLIAVPVWIRPVHHPFFIVVFLLVFIKTFRDKHWSQLISLLLPYLFFFLPWQYFQSKILSISSYETENVFLILSHLPQLISVIPDTLLVLLNNFIEFSYAGLTGILCLSAYIFQFFKDKKKINVISIVILFIFLAVWFVLSLSVYVSMPSYENYLGILGDSMRRLFIFIYPLVVYTALSLPNIKSIFGGKK